MSYLRQMVPEGYTLGWNKGGTNEHFGGWGSRHSKSGRVGGERREREHQQSEELWTVRRAMHLAINLLFHTIEDPTGRGYDKLVDLKKVQAIAIEPSDAVGP